MHILPCFLRSIVWIEISFVSKEVGAYMKKGFLFLLFLILSACASENVKEIKVVTVTLSSDPSSVSESASSGVILTATLSQIADSAVSVSLSTSGTSTEGADYTNLSAITIAAGSLSGTTTLIPSDDAIYEGDETAIIAIANVTGADATESGNQSTTITISEDEMPPTVSLSATTSSVYDNESSLVITATSTQAAQATITVSISTSGSAVEGVDYVQVADITIVAGSTSGTTIFDPIADNENEGNETAIVAISAVSGADATANGVTSVSITIKEYALRTGTLFVEGTATEQTAITDHHGWQKVDYSGSASSVHPYEQMNIHKVQSFSNGGVKLTGAGQLIHIADFNCDDSHEVYDNKIIYNLDNGGLGESTFAAATASDHHCQFVASMAAGDSSGSNSVMGVAPDADLVLSSIPDYSGASGYDDYAVDLDTAKSYGAVVSNNSWGIGDDTDGNPNANLNYTEFIQLGYNLTASQLQYVQALNNFQDSGVVVFSSGNYSGESDISFLAALPELRPELKEAWLAVGLVDFTGADINTATETDFILYGNKCGSAKEYCLVADGYQLNGASHIDEGVHKYDINGSGSSYSAPMVSGGVALLTQAFPNHTPEQLTDRILASANNNWFTPQGETVFSTHGNGVSHGYHSSWGHGLPDFYAALSPITTSSNPALMLYTGNSIQSGVGYDLPSTVLVSNNLAGSSLTDALSSVPIFAYDALSGGFEYKLQDLVVNVHGNGSELKFDKLFGLTGRVNNNNRPENTPPLFANVINNHDVVKVTYGGHSLPVQKLFSGLDAKDQYNNHPLLSGNKVIGLNFDSKLNSGDLLIGYSSNIQTDGNAQNETSVSVMFSPRLKNTLSLGIFGMLHQADGEILGIKGSGAFGFSDVSASTLTSGIKYQLAIGPDIELSGAVLGSKTWSTGTNDGLIKSINAINASTASLAIRKVDIVGDDQLTVAISQPFSMTSGSMAIAVPGLADAQGNIGHSIYRVSLAPGTREIKLKLSYAASLSRKTDVLIENIWQQNVNNMAGNELESSSFIGFKHNNIKAGLGYENGNFTKGKLELGGKF